jgi:hypothetical protein
MSEPTMFVIEDAVAVIRRAQQRADRLGIAQAIVVRDGELAIANAASATDTIEICHPARSRRRQDSEAVET